LQETTTTPTTPPFCSGFTAIGSRAFSFVAEAPVVTTSGLLTFTAFEGSRVIPLDEYPGFELHSADPDATRKLFPKWMLAYLVDKTNWRIEGEGSFLLVTRKRSARDNAPIAAENLDGFVDEAVQIAERFQRADDATIA